MNHKVTLIVGYPPFFNNRFFSSEFPNVLDDTNHCFCLLKKYLSSYNVDLSTEDINSPKTADIVILINYRRGKYKFNKSQKLYLIINEPKMINPKSWDINIHKRFDRVFTWYEPFVDNKKRFLLRLGYRFYPDFNISKSLCNRKLCTLIAGNKRSNKSNELYSERLRAIEWFTKNHPEDFEFYGREWNSYIFNGILDYIKPYLPQKMLQSWPKRKCPYSTYKGQIVSKHEILARYKFSICYENIKNTSDFITEKIFDSFSAGCVPIYWGSSNISEFIPGTCFIDRRKFSIYEKLYKYISNMNSDQYLKYLKNIKDFLTGNQSAIFRAEVYANTLVKYILQDLGIKSVRNDV